ncbi:hypothetical protein [Amycolatopsis sp. NBC_01286]|uniref:hypothetical protein n=1 Tax=Amycolatopsis sp. NBC_01286 TaxID=2903560 RepID=UPI003FA36D78
MPAGHPLWSCPGLILSPHMARTRPRNLPALLRRGRGPAPPAARRRRTDERGVRDVTNS